MTTYQQVQETAKSLGFQSYPDYLRSDHWKELKRTRLKGEVCCVCGGTKTLLAHHSQYRNLLDVALTDLEPMCFRCHDIFHMACRFYKIPYIGLGAVRIAEITKAFMLTAKFQKWDAKMTRRRAGIKRPPLRHAKESKNHIKRRFKQLMKGKLSAHCVKEFCDWLTKQTQFAE